MSTATYGSRRWLYYNKLILRNQEWRIVMQFNIFSHLARKKKKISERDYSNVAPATTRKDQIFVYFGELDTWIQIKKGENLKGRAIIGYSRML